MVVNQVGWVVTQHVSEESRFTEDSRVTTQPTIPDEKTEAGVGYAWASVSSRRDADTARLRRVQAASLTVSM